MKYASTNVLETDTVNSMSGEIGVRSSELASKPALSGERMGTNLSLFASSGKVFVWYGGLRSLLQVSAKICRK